MVELAPTSSIGGVNSELKQTRTTIAENFDTFLNILTTQLKNQNPLDPMDTNQFTQQMVQFTGVEQQLKTNEYLEALIKANEGSFASQAVSYIGKSVTAFSNTTDLKDDSAEWTYGLTADAPDSLVTIKNSAGAVVFSEEVELDQGEHTYTWDGVASDGTISPEGKYSINIEAKNSDGKIINNYVMTKGIVETVDFAGEEPVLLVNGSQIPLSTVTKVGAATS